MQKKTLFILTLSVCASTFAFTQNKGNLDAVHISKSYYNSIVKILLYDSAAVKINADWGYLGRGSGFFVTKDGYIFTNRHVVDYCRGYCRYTTYNNDEKKEEPNIDVYSPSLLNDKTLININYTGRASVIVQVYDNPNGSKYTLYRAKVIAIDTANFDGAILKIVSDINGNSTDNSFHPVPFGNSDSTEQGQDLCLYGFPAQISGNFKEMLNDLSTLMFGKHAGFDYNINNQFGFIKTDATINSGNSGGPVFGPANNVIGLATATFTKTNLGLVGGINDMYELVHLLPDLENELLKNGFIKPQKKPDVATAMLFKPNFIPRADALKKINNMKSGNKVSKSLGFSLGIMGEVPHAETIGIDDFNGQTPSGYLSTSTNGGKTNLIPSIIYGVDFKFHSRSILKNQEKNLLGGLFNISAEQRVLNWNQPNVYTTPYPTTFKMSTSIKTFFVNMMIGVCYARVLENGIILGFYYEIGYSLADLSDETIGTAYSYGQTAPIQMRADNLIVPQTFGINVRYKSWYADVSYTFYSEKLVYTLPYDYFQGLFYTDYLVSGKAQHKAIQLGIGYILDVYPKKH